MAEYNYSFRDYDKEIMARSVGMDLPISTKHSLEICNMIRRMNLVKAKSILNDVIEKKRAVPFKRFNNGVGHRKGRMTSGRYPVKSSKGILDILESAETNAQQKGLNTSRLSIIHISAKKASRPIRYGRHRGREMKRTHMEVVLSEAAEEKGKEEKRKPAEAEEKKQKEAPAKEKPKEEGRKEKEGPRQGKKEGQKQEEMPEEEPKKNEKPAENKPETKKSNDKKESSKGGEKK